MTALRARLAAGVEAEVAELETRPLAETDRDGLSGMQRRRPRGRGNY